MENSKKTPKDTEGGISERESKFYADSFIRLAKEFSNVILSIKFFDNDIVEISFVPSKEVGDKELKRLFDLFGMALNEVIRDEMKNIQKLLIKDGFRFKERIIS